MPAPKAPVSAEKGLFRERPYAAKAFGVRKGPAGRVHPFAPGPSRAPLSSGLGPPGEPLPGPAGGLWARPAGPTACRGRTRPRAGQAARRVPATLYYSFQHGCKVQPYGTNILPCAPPWSGPAVIMLWLNYGDNGSMFQHGCILAFRCLCNSSNDAIHHSAGAVASAGP